MEGERYVGRKFRVEFVEKVPTSRVELARELMYYSRLLNSEGVNPGSCGNLSARIDEGMLITAGGVDKKEINEEDMVEVVDYIQEDNRASVRGLREPSSETPMHWLIYGNYPGTCAIIHCHDPVVLKKSHVLREAGITTTGREEPYGTRALANQVVGALKHSSYVFIREHGSLSVGINLRDAFDLMLKVHKKFDDESKDR